MELCCACEKGLTHGYSCRLESCGARRSVPNTPLCFVSMYCSSERMVSLSFGVSCSRPFTHWLGLTFVLKTQALSFYDLFGLVWPISDRLHLPPDRQKKPLLEIGFCKL